MPVFLKHRNPHLPELMDMEDCDLGKLENTYRHFVIINSLLSKWNTIYRQFIKPCLKAHNGTLTLLDIGFGGGDIPKHLHLLAKKDGFRLEITAIETDKRALAFVQHQNPNPEITFLHTSSGDLVRANKRFDIVISNHLLHHLCAEELSALLKDAEQLATRCVIFNDIERSDAGYALYAIFSRLLFRNSFAVYDGSLSIRRSFTLPELRRAAPKRWSVRRMFPFRLLLLLQKDMFEHEHS